MAEVAIENRVFRYEAKPQPTANTPGKIVEAFGLGKCPKLAEQVRSESLLVRVNTLKVLCDEFKNPTIIAGSVKAGLMRQVRSIRSFPVTLPKMVLDSDLDTRKFSSETLAAAARDYNGRAALLEASKREARAPETIFTALDDGSVDVRRNVYEALANTSTIGPGTRALVDAGYPAKLVDKAVNETEELQPLALRVLCNVIKHRGGLEAALAASLVENLIGLLDDGRPAEVQRKASKTLAIACFDDMAKIIAIQNNGVSMLAELVAKAGTEVRSAAMGALMMITTVDAGKRAVLSTSAAEEAVKALGEHDDVLLLNALKLVASIAAHPDIRAELKEDTACLPAIRRLQSNVDPIIAKHASIALEAVLWEP
ncbi:unnamed protein product [Pylaiella littoralis]